MLMQLQQVEGQAAVAELPARQDTGTPSVLIIILTYNGCALTVSCLESLERVRTPNVSVLVVDNASHDDTRAVLQTRFPEIPVIACETNLGFAVGNNIGLQYASAMDFRYALLLNNDTEVAPDFLEPLVEMMEQEPSYGAVGPLIYYHAQPDRIWSAGGIVRRNLGKTEMRGLDEVDTGQYNQTATVDFVTGCALLVRVAALPAVGLIDPRFGMYYEETEWCARIRRTGYAIAVVPKSRIWHKISPDRQALSKRVTYYMTRNRLLYLRLTNAPVRAWLHATFLQDWRTWLSWNLRPRWKDRREAKQAIPMAWRDFLLGRFGMVTIQQ